jgi:hypothetical protein
MGRLNLVTVEFIEIVYLPRFNMDIGDRFKVRADRISEDGFTLGAGFVKTCQFKVIKTK